MGDYCGKCAVSGDETFLWEVLLPEPWGFMVNRCVDCLPNKEVGK